MNRSRQPRPCPPESPSVNTLKMGGIAQTAGKNCNPREDVCIAPAAVGRGVFDAKPAAAVNVKKTLENLREEVMYCFRVTYADRDLANRLVLELAKMGMLEEELKKTDNPKKRKEILQRFIRSKTAIEYWVLRFKQSKIRKPDAGKIEQELRNVVKHS